MCSSTCSKADGKGQGKEGEGGQQQDKEKVEVGNLVEWGDWEAFEPRSAFVPEMIMRITRTMKISMLIKMVITIIYNNGQGLPRHLQTYSTHQAAFAAGLVIVSSSLACTFVYMINSFVAFKSDFVPNDNFSHLFHILLHHRITQCLGDSGNKAVSGQGVPVLLDAVSQPFRPQHVWPLVSGEWKPNNSHFVLDRLGETAEPTVGDEHLEVGVGKEVLLWEPGHRKQVDRRVRQDATPSPDHRQLESAKDFNKELRHLRRHVLCLEGGAKRDENRPTGGVVKEHLEVSRKGPCWSQVQSSNLNYVRQVGPGSVGDRVAGCKHHRDSLRQNQVR